MLLAAQLGDRFTIEAVGVFDDPHHRPVMVLDATPDGVTFVVGRPYNSSHGHFIRVRARGVPGDDLVATYMIGCHLAQRVDESDAPDSAALLVPVDERYCRGPFTAIMCDPDRCWIAGWY